MIKRCPVCDVEFNTETGLFQVSKVEYNNETKKYAPTGRQSLTKEAFAKKACVLAKKPGCINSCSNLYTAADCSWETSKGLDSKSEVVLQELGVDQQVIDELKKPLALRTPEN